VLLNGAGTDFEFGGDVLVAAALDKQLQNLLVAAGNFDLIEINHGCLFASRMKFAAYATGAIESTCFAKVSP